MTSQPPIFLLAADERFDGTNWVEWKGTILSAADARGLDGYLDGTTSKPADPSPGQAAPTATAYWGSKTPSQEEWQQRNC